MEKLVLSKTAEYVKLFYHIMCQLCHVIGLLWFQMFSFDFPKVVPSFKFWTEMVNIMCCLTFVSISRRSSCFLNTLIFRKHCSEKSVSNMTWFSASHLTWNRCHLRAVLLQFFLVLLQFNMSQLFLLFILHLFQHFIKWGALDSITASSIILKAKSYQCWNLLSTSSLKIFSSSCVFVI